MCWLYARGRALNKATNWKISAKSKVSPRVQGKKSKKKNDENCGPLFIYKIISQSSIDRIILGAYLSVKDG